MRPNNCSRVACCCHCCALAERVSKFGPQTAHCLGTELGTRARTEDQRNPTQKRPLPFSNWSAQIGAPKNEESKGSAPQRSCRKTILFPVFSEWACPATASLCLCVCRLITGHWPASSVGRSSALAGRILAPNSTWRWADRFLNHQFHSFGQSLGLLVLQPETCTRPHSIPTASRLEHDSWPATKETPEAKCLPGPQAGWLPDFGQPIKVQHGSGRSGARTNSELPDGRPNETSSLRSSHSIWLVACGLWP